MRERFGFVEEHQIDRPCRRLGFQIGEVLAAGRHRRCVLAPFEGMARPPRRQTPLAQLVREPPRRDRRPAASGNLSAQTRQRPAAVVARIFVQDRRGDRPGMRPDLGLLSRPRAPPQPRHPAMRKVTPPVAHRADVHPENRGDLLGRRPSSVSKIARARSASPRCSDFDRARNPACSAASAVSFDFPAMLASTALIPGKQSIPSPILTRSA